MTHCYREAGDAAGGAEDTAAAGLASPSSARRVATDTGDARSVASHRTRGRMSATALSTSKGASATAAPAAQPRSYRIVAYRGSDLSTEVRTRFRLCCNLTLCGPYHQPPRFLGFCLILATSFACGTWQHECNLLFRPRWR